MPPETASRSEPWQGRDPFEWLSKASGDVVRRFKNRFTLRIHHREQALYVKYHGPAPWRELLFTRLRDLSIGADVEWRALHLLRQRGIPAPTPVSRACSGRRLTTRRSLIVTEAMDGSIDLASLCRHWHTATPNYTEKLNLINCSADLIRNMHDAGVRHRDLYLCHLRLDMDSPPQAPRLSLMDLHRAEVREPIPKNWRIRDLGALLFSSLECGFSQRDLLRFAHRYSASESLSAQRRFWAKVGKRAARLEKREARRARRHAR